MAQPASRSIRDPRDGFTLLEIMVVLALIGVIVGAIAVTVFNQLIEGKIKTTQIQIRDLQGRVQQYQISRDGCPTADDLVTAMIIRRVPKDAWGNPLMFRCPGEHPPDPADIVSDGPDKTPDTKDDIRSWDL